MRHTDVPVDSAGKVALLHRGQNAIIHVEAVHRLHILEDACSREGSDVINLVHLKLGKALPAGGVRGEPGGQSRGQHPREPVHCKGCDVLDGQDQKARRQRWETVHRVAATVARKKLFGEFHPLRSVDVCLHSEPAGKRTYGSSRDVVILRDVVLLLDNEEGYPPVGEGDAGLPGQPVEHLLVVEAFLQRKPLVLSLKEVISNEHPQELEGREGKGGRE